MSSVARNARLNWLQHYILPIQQRQGIVMRVLEPGYFPSLFHVIREVHAMQWDPLEVGLSFFCALYGLKPDTPMEEARYQRGLRRSEMTMDDTS